MKYDNRATMMGWWLAATLGIAMGLADCDSNTESTTDAVVVDDPYADGNYLGTWDDLPINDNDPQALQQLLDDKWTYFLYEMDLYSLERDSSLNDAFVADVMEFVFADEFEFNAYLATGGDFGETQGTYTPLSWLENQDIDSWNQLAEHSTMLVPNYRHVLSIEEPGQRAILRGYHEHLFHGPDLRLAVGDARHMNFETIVFEKQDGVWRVTDYEETIYSASEADAPDEPPPPPGP